jgi:hypothetical protein
MKQLFTVMLVWEDDRLAEAMSRMQAEKARFVLVRDGEPTALLVPFSDHEALELGLWEKGAKEHLANIFGEELPEPAAYTTQELADEPDIVPTAENFDVLETGTLMQFDTCRKCGQWVWAKEKNSHQC